jgi:peptidyl-prolyl cis-trans isomerase A (cyclophilin A)
MANQNLIIKTSMGSMEVELFVDKAPVSTENFLEYAKAGHYTDCIFHRVIPGFMVQGGGFGKDFEQKPTRAPIGNEADNGLKNKRGTLAMARTAQVDSATSQFFINVADNAFLDHGSRDFGYAVFAKVSKGMDVVDAIAGKPTGAKGQFGQDCPLEDVYIESVSLV